MGFFDSEENVDAYVRMAEGFDGRELVAVLERHLPPGSSVLEIGMGPGKDLHWLGRRFRPTGSDNSSIFVDRARAADPSADVLALDAVTLETDRRFDAIYSNKVLHHLTPDELARSLRAQRRLLREGGLALHALWRGDRLEVHQGERFQYYTAQTFAERMGESFEIVETGTYAEMDDDDSLYVVLRCPVSSRLAPRDGESTAPR
ncbi:MAG: methyltransferase domain-containing protein [Acidobacteria bacterium]|nr:methyltransferase domain-containing protein [Acidobacteriota bacterium]